MPRSKTGRKRPGINEEEELEKAVDDVIRRNISFRDAAKAHGVKIGTLHAHAQKFKKISE